MDYRKKKKKNPPHSSHAVPVALFSGGEDGRREGKVGGGDEVAAMTEGLSAGWLQ